MNITLVRHLWGVDLTHGLAHYAPHWREVGYEALEASLRHVPAQIFSHDFQPGGTVREHLDSLRDQMEECLAHEPMFFNAHSGSDTWSAAEAEDFYGQARDLEKKIGVPVSHETHRQRYFATPWQTRHILQQFPDLRITCDLSHWVVVGERLYTDPADAEWPQLFAKVARNTHLIHARVGYSQGPQACVFSFPLYCSHFILNSCGVLSWWIGSGSVGSRVRDGVGDA